MNTEHNRDQLKKTLAQLPVYSPPPAHWDSLAQALDAPAEEGTETLQRSLTRLPVYAAPADGWRRLVRELPARRRAIRWSVAAAVAALLGLGFWWFSLEPAQRLPLSERRLHDRAGLPVPEQADFDPLGPLLARADSCWAARTEDLPPEWAARWERLQAERARYDSLLALPPDGTRHAALTEAETHLRGSLFQLGPWLCQEPGAQSSQ